MVEQWFVLALRIYTKACNNEREPDNAHERVQKLINGCSGRRECQGRMSCLYFYIDVCQAPLFTWDEVIKKRWVVRKF